MLRGGWGIYFNPNQMNTFTFLTNNPPLAPRFTYNNDTANPTLSFEHPTGVATTSPPDITTPNRDLPNAWKNQWSLDIQHELWRSTVAEVQHSPPGRRTSIGASSSIRRRPAPGRFSAPAESQLRQYPSDRERPDRQLRLARVRAAPPDDGRLSLNAHYTWSRTFDMSEHSNGGGAIVNDFDIWSDYSRASWDVPHRFVVSGIYELPFFRDSGSLLMRGLLGGWQVSGVATFQSGTPLNVTIQGDRANVGRTPQRPDVLSDVELTCEPNPSGLGLINCIDATAFAQPAQFTFGNARATCCAARASAGRISRCRRTSTSPGAHGSWCRRRCSTCSTRSTGAPQHHVRAANFGRVTSASSMRQMELGVRVTF